MKNGGARERDAARSVSLGQPVPAWLLRSASAAALLAAALPVVILIGAPPTWASDLETLVSLHRQPLFGLRAALTMLYFPAAVAAHFALVGVVESRRRGLALFGITLFAAGCFLDLLYRCGQFFLAHYGWAAAYLAADLAERGELAARLGAFGEVAPVFSIAFGWLFGLGRVVLAAGLHPGGAVSRLLTVALAATGMLNLHSVTVLTLGAPGRPPAALYLTVWLAGLILLALFLWRASTSGPAAVHPEARGEPVIGNRVERNEDEPQ